MVPFSPVALTALLSSVFKFFGKDLVG